MMKLQERLRVIPGPAFFHFMINQELREASRLNPQTSTGPRSAAAGFRRGRPVSRKNAFQSEKYVCFKNHPSGKTESGTPFPSITCFGNWVRSAKMPEDPVGTPAPAESFQSLEQKLGSFRQNT